MERQARTKAPMARRAGEKPAAVRVLTLLALVAVVAGCDLTFSDEPISYAALSDGERAAVDRIFARLQAYDARLERAVSAGYVLGAIAVDHDRIDVAVRDLWLMANIGDDRIHLSVWENLTDGQRARFAAWMGGTEAAVAGRFGRFFYDFMALHLAGVQTVFAVQGVDWAYLNRSAFNIDRDAQRLVVTFLSEVDGTLLAEARATCASIRAALDDRFGAWFDQTAYGDHFRELTDPRDPSGQIYMICRHLEQAEIRKAMFHTTFAAEIEMLEIRRSADGTTILGF